MVKRKLKPKARAANAAPAKAKPHCVGCFCADPLVDLHLQEDSYAETLFEIRKDDAHLACVSCAFHADLVSQLRCALQDSLRRPVVSCLVCRASGQLLELRSIEGAQEALGLELLEAKHISKQVTSTKQVCTACAYALQWLYNRSLQNKQAKMNVTVALPSRNTVAPSRNLKVTINRVDESSSIPVGRATRKPPVVPAEAKKTKPTVKPSRGVRAAAPPPSLVTTSPRRLRKRNIVDVSDSDSDSENDTKRRRIPNKQVQKVTQTKSRRIVPPARLTYADKEPIPKITIKLGKNAAIKREKRVVAKSTRNSTEVKEKKIPERRYRQMKQEPVELTEYECKECSQMFYSGVSAELHKLEHIGRIPTVKLTRCALPAVDIQDMQVSSSDDDTSTATDARRKPRKSQSPRKNAALDRLKADSETNSNFVFVAPLRVACPRDIQDNKKDGKTIEFDFGKPIIVTPATKNDDFSDEEDSDTENINECITSLENNEKEAADENSAIDAKENEEQNGTEVTEENEDTLPAEKCDSYTNVEGENKQPELTKITENSSEGIDNEPPGSTKITNVHPDNTPPINNESPASPNKSANINSILSFDFEAPLIVKPSKAVEEKINPPSPSKLKSSNNSETTETPNLNLSGSFESLSGGDDYVNGCSDLASVVSSAISEHYPQDEGYAPNTASVGFDTSHALRDDSSNPTLPQNRPRDPQYPFSPPDMKHIEKLVSEVVGGDN